MSLQHMASHQVLIYLVFSVLLCAHTQGNYNNSSGNKNTRNNTNNLIIDFLNSNESMYLLYSKHHLTDMPAPKCHQATSTKHIVLAIVSSCIVILGVVGNLMVIFVIQYSHLRNEPGYTLVMSLAAADLGVSLFLTSNKVHSYRMNGNFCSDISVCVFHHIIDGLFPTASITHLLLISINKFCAVISPYNYHTLVTRTRETLVILCAWVYCLVWTFSGMVVWDKDPKFSIHVLSDGIDRVCYNHNATFYLFAAIFVYIVPVIVAGTLYITLMFIVMEKMKSTPRINQMERTSLDAHQRDSAEQSFSNTKGAKTLMLVFGGWVVCWVPHFSTVLVQYANDDVLVKFHEDHPRLSEFIGTIISDVLPCINSCINPFIYFKSSYIFRHAFKNNYLKLMKKPRYRAGSSSVAAKLQKTSVRQSVDTVVKYTACDSKELVSFVTERPSY